MKHYVSSAYTPTYLLKHVPQSVLQARMVIQEPCKKPLLLVADTWLLALYKKTVLEPLH